jgi:hypothetical protein
MSSSAEMDYTESALDWRIQANQLIRVEGQIAGAGRMVAIPEVTREQEGRWADNRTSRKPDFPA